LNPSQLWDQVSANIALDHVATRASRYSRPLKSPRIVLADDENLNRGKFRLDNLSYFQAIHGRHRDVEEYDIRLMLSYFADGISPVYRLANNFDVRLGMKNVGNAATDALVVVYHEHTKCAFNHSVSGGFASHHRFIKLAVRNSSRCFRLGTEAHSDDCKTPNKQHTIGKRL
jgi:hypothetical protein